MSLPPLKVQDALHVAMQHHSCGRREAAEGICRQILAVQPSNVEALHLLGLLAAQGGKLDAAADMIRKVIALRPRFPEALNNLGGCLQGMGRLEEAIVAYSQALAISPDHPEALYNLGNALRARGELEQAVNAYRRAIAVRPNHAAAQNNLGNALMDSGRLDDALAAYRRAIELAPTYAEASFNLANALSAKGQFDQAVAAYHKAIQLKPNYPKAHYNLGNVLKSKGEMDGAEEAYRQAIALKPDFAEAHNNIGGALLRKGLHETAIASYRRAVELDPENSGAHDNLVHGLHYHPACDPRTIADEHFRWNERHGEPLKKLIKPFGHDRDPDRRLRVGYVSTDFFDHPVGRFLLPLLENHDRQCVSVIAYAQVPRPDAMTDRLRGHTDSWRDLVGLSDDQAANLIRQDRIDVLVDLVGHMAGSRILVFVRKPAPVQVTYLGYPDTTGLSTIDYRVTDAFCDPPGLTEMYHSERLVRLSPCAWCFQPALSPPVSARDDGPITFGCFNNFAKVTEPMLKVWGQTMHEVPGSRLLLKAAGLGNASCRERVQAVLAHGGIGPERLDLLREEPDYTEHLKHYQRIDIAFDTFPYHGTTTTCEALWMGVPVVSLAGSSHVSRVGVSLLSNVGLPELVAGSVDEYQRIAIELAGDLPRLEHLRSTLRQRMQASPLMDASQLARNVESAYRQMWQQWCATSEALSERAARGRGPVQGDL